MLGFVNLRKKENGTPVNIAEETSQKFSDLKDSKGKDMMASKLKDRNTWEKQR